MNIGLDLGMARELSNSPQWRAVCEEIDKRISLEKEKFLALDPITQQREIIAVQESIRIWQSVKRLPEDVSQSLEPIQG